MDVLTGRKKKDLLCFKAIRYSMKFIKCQFIKESLLIYPLHAYDWNNNMLEKSFNESD
jgi:hypothetical protein